MDQIKRSVCRFINMASDAAAWNVAAATEASAHYGESLTRCDRLTYWLQGFFSVLNTTQPDQEDTQVQSQRTGKKAVGVSRDLMTVLRIQAADDHVIEFFNVDTRFNDCNGWEVRKDGERVYFNTRQYERFSDVKSGVLSVITLCQKYPQDSDSVLLAAAKAMLSVLDSSPSFAALAAHPDRIKP
ncbi:hypothetical protein RN333_22015 (plasmid) [Enterobacter kobei]|uniref:hypothetical protein n=1 Tax=Enterobacter kobei TaxID=208224 RepID=UPI001F5DD07F|nr:hypothetical protein [Enterobacter kobei]WNP36925.1 hypothetical protein RN333_22015 [Enterobacter kobei]